MNKSTRCLKFIFLILLFSEASFACSFHMIPPFGADWYHQSFFPLFYQGNQGSSFGVVFSQRQFEKIFSDDDETESLKKTISYSSFFYHNYINPRLQFLIAVTETNIRADALADDGIVKLSSSSMNQLSINFDYLLKKIKLKGLPSELHFTTGMNTAIEAYNSLNCSIGWMKYEWNKISPRVIAGNYKMNFVIGMTGIIEKENIKIHAATSSRIFIPDNQGFVLGSEINSSVNAGYRFHIPGRESWIEPQAGINYEHGSIDWQKTLKKESRVMAQGSDFFFSAGGQIRIKKFNLSCVYFKPFAEYNFSEYQSYNKAQLLITFQYFF